MDWTDRTEGTPTRRQLLFVTAVGTATLAGCISGDGDSDGSTDDGENGTVAETDDDTENSTEADGANDQGNSENSTADDADDSGDSMGTGAAAVPVRGDPDAEVVLEVYEDLGCPACRNYVENGFPELETQYIDEERIRYEHRDFPVIGPASAQAASAAREALARHGNDAFWEFVSAVFANQDRLEPEGPALLSELAADLDLDAEAIATAGEERAHQSVVDRDFERGQQLGVRGTPSFVVNGELVDPGDIGSMAELVGAVSDRLDAALDDADDSPY